MSSSSESDVTIPIQDSPEPPTQLKSKSGIENKGYVYSSNHTVETPLDRNIVNLIPAKPSPQLGPFEPLNDYFIPINHHKKFFRRSEKLYVTKSKKKQGRLNWNRLICGGLGILLLAGGFTVALLVILDVLHLPLWSTSSQEEQVSEFISTFDSSITSTSTSYSSEVISSSTSGVASSTPQLSSIYLKRTADVEFSLEKKYEAALANKSSTIFQQLSIQLQGLVIQMLGESIQPDSVVAKVQEFTPESGGSIYTKLRIGWSDETLTMMGLQFALRNVTALGLGPYSVKHLKFFEVVNLCKFSNHGCSHTCSLDSIHLQFECSCPQSLFLATDFKTCVQVSDAAVTETDEVSISTSTTTEQVATSPEDEVHQPSTSTTTITTPTTVIRPEQPQPDPGSPPPTGGNITDAYTTTSTTISTTITTVSTTTASPEPQGFETTEAPDQAAEEPNVTDGAIQSEISPTDHEGQSQQQFSTMGITMSTSTPTTMTTTTASPEEEAITKSSDIGQTERSEHDENSGYSPEKIDNDIDLLTTITPEDPITDDVVMVTDSV